MVVDVVVVRFPDSMGRDRGTGGPLHCHETFPLLLLPRGSRSETGLRVVRGSGGPSQFQREMVIARLSARKERHHSTILAEKHGVGVG
jgi:hypothetical protein